MRSAMAYAGASSRTSRFSRHGRSSIDLILIEDLKPRFREQSGRSSGSKWQNIMSTKLYIGNLSLDVTENDLRDMLSKHGPVNEINVIMDKMTGRARGFAFVTMNTPEGSTAVLALNGKEWNGRALTVNEARPREERSGGGGGHGGRRYSDR